MDKCMEEIPVHNNLNNKLKYRRGRRRKIIGEGPRGRRTSGKKTRRKEKGDGATFGALSHESAL